MDLSGDSVLKESTCQGRSLGGASLIPELRRASREGNGNPLQYSCLENPMDQGAWWATVHGVAKSQTRLSDFTSSHYIRNKSSSNLGVREVRGNM